MNALQIELLRIEAKYLAAASAKLARAAEHKNWQALLEENPPKVKHFISDPTVHADVSDFREIEAETYLDAARESRELNAVAANAFNKPSGKADHGRKRRGR